MKRIAISALSLFIAASPAVASAPSESPLLCRALYVAATDIMQDTQDGISLVDQKLAILEAGHPPLLERLMLSTVGVAEDVRIYTEPEKVERAKQKFGEMIEGFCLDGTFDNLDPVQY